MSGDNECNTPNLLRTPFLRSRFSRSKFGDGCELQRDGAESGAVCWPVVTSTDTGSVESEKHGGEWRC